MIQSKSGATHPDERAKRKQARKKELETANQHIGRRIKTQRLLHEMSQEKLAQALGLSFQQVQKYEKGVNRVSASRLSQIAAFFGVSIEYFLEDCPSLACSPPFATPRFDADYLTMFLSTGQGNQLLTSFLQISDTTLRKQLIELMTTLGGGKPQLEDQGC